MVTETYSKSMDQPGQVANPAPRGQLNRKINISLSAFFVPEKLVSRDGFGSVSSRDSLLISILRLNLVLRDFFCVFYVLLVYRDDVLCWLFSCPFSSVCFPCLSPNVFPVGFGLVPSIM